MNVHVWIWNNGWAYVGVTTLAKFALDLAGGKIPQFFSLYPIFPGVPNA